MHSLSAIGRESEVLGSHPGGNYSRNGLGEPLTSRMERKFLRVGDVVGALAMQHPLVLGLLLWGRQHSMVAKIWALCTGSPESLHY